MVSEFADHATRHGGFDAGLIRSVASDLHERTCAVMSLAVDLERSGGAPSEAEQQQIDAELDRFADHVAACGDVLHDLRGRRRAS